MNEPTRGFEMESIVLSLEEILPIRLIQDPDNKISRYKAIRSSIQEVGLVEPLIVSRSKDKFILVDGHLRLHAMKSLGMTEAECLISTDDESFTYNARISRLAPIQEHKMILKAVKDGLTPERIATALNLRVKDIRDSLRLLEGIHEEVADMLKDKQVAPGAIHGLKKVTAVRQIEIAELMVSTNTFTRNYVDALLIGTPKQQLLHPREPKAAKGMTVEEIARLEEEMESLHTDFKAIETTYGDNVLNLTVARSYVKKLLENTKVSRFLKTRHEDLFSEFEILAAKELL